MFTGILILNLFIGVFILIKGLKYYNTSFALAWLFPLLAFHIGYGQDIILKIEPILALLNLEDPSTINLGIWLFIGSSTLIVFFFTKILTYLYMPIVVVASILALLLSPFYPDGLPSFYGNIGAVLVIVFWVLLIVWKKLRTYVKTPMIGILAGINIYLPLSLLLTKAWNLSLLPIVSTILYLIIVPGSIALEIGFFAPIINKQKNIVKE